MKKLLHKWHWFWFKRHTKWLLTEQRDMVYNTLYQSINDYLMNDINKICIVDKPYTEDDIIRLCNAIENSSYKPIICGNNSKPPKCTSAER